jgi:protein O-mannosyl-transferase
VAGNELCEPDAEVAPSPISQLWLVHASPTSLVRPTITDPVSYPSVIGDWAPSSRLSQVATYLRREWLRVLLLVVIGVIVRAPALQGQRIWDDQYLSLDNPFIKSPLLILESLRHRLFLDSFSAHYRPVQNISYFADYFFWNTDEFGFHLTNVLLHVGSGILLYFLLRQLLASLCLHDMQLAVRNRVLKRLPWISHAAFLVALLWVVHPVHSAAIDYISGRADSLAFFFAAAGWLLFLRGRRNKQRFFRASLYALAALSGLLALLSREIAVIWIVLFLAHVFLVERRLPRRFRIGAFICCAGVVLLYFGCRQLPQQRIAPVRQGGWGAPVRAALMARALGDYGRLMVFPANLNLERTVFDPIGYQSNTTWRKEIRVEYLSILGLFLLAAFIFGSVKHGPGQHMRIFGAGWFLAAYLPVSNIVELNATVAEHWLYLPSVGFLIFVAGCALELPRRHWKIAATTALVATAALSARSYVRSTDWVTAETFYRRTLAAGGTSPRTGLNLAQIYSNRGQYADAEKILRKVLQLAPDYPTAQNNLASALSHEGKTKEAEAMFALIEKKSLETRKEYPMTWIGAVNLARLRHNAGDNQSAIAILDRTRKDYPDVWEAVSLESELTRETQGAEAALRLVENFTRDNWWHYGATLALGRLYAQKNEAGLAEAALRRASRLDVHETEALRQLVFMRLCQNRFEEAVLTQRRAIARQPDEPRQYILLSNILEKMGRTEEARATLAKASHLRTLAEAPVAPL